MFVVAIPLLGLYHKTDEYTGSGCSLKKNNTTSTDRKIAELECPIKEKEDRIASNKVLQFLQQEKEGRRTKAQRSCNFSSKEPLSKRATDMNEIHCCIFNLNLYSFA